MGREWQRLKLSYKTFLQIITSLFSSLTTDSFLFSPVFPNSWTGLTTELWGFNQGVRNPQQYYYHSNTRGLLPEETSKPLGSGKSWSREQTEVCYCWHPCYTLIISCWQDPKAAAGINMSLQSQGIRICNHLQEAQP